MPTMNALRTTMAIFGIAAVQRAIGDKYIVIPSANILGFTLIPLVP
jgi:hypothetical protein